MEPGTGRTIRGNLVSWKRGLMIPDGASTQRGIGERRSPAADAHVTLAG
jgi:hypothetical protein